MTAGDEQHVMVSGNSAEPLPDKRKGTGGSLVCRIRGSPRLRIGLLCLIILIAIGGGLYWNDMQSRVYVEDSQVTAPVIAISAGTSGVIDQLYVSTGDSVRRNQILAKVDDVVLTAKTDGVITDVQDTPGQRVTATETVISMIDPQKLRVTGKVEEDKGLADIRPGQQVMFTVDAYPSRRYTGEVEKVAPSYHEGDIVFSISDKRQEQDFDVTVIYDVTAYPELKNGMSAKMWISR